MVRAPDFGASSYHPCSSCKFPEHLCLECKKTPCEIRKMAAASKGSFWDGILSFEQFWSLSLRRNGPKNCSARARARALQLWGSFSQPLPDQMVDFGCPKNCSARARARARTAAFGAYFLSLCLTKWLISAFHGPRGLAQKFPRLQPVSPEL